MAKLTVHHLEDSRSQRILWLLEELALEYEVVRYDRVGGARRAPKELLDVHPLGKSPVITHDGVVVAESGAIVEHLVDLAGGALRPEPGTEEHRRYRFFLHFAEGSMMPPLLVKLIFGQVRKAVPIFGKLIANKVDDKFTDREIQRHADFVEAELEDRDYLCGDALTAADVMMSFPLQATFSRLKRSGSYPRTRAYLSKLEKRDAYERALERGGPFELMV